MSAKRPHQAAFGRWYNPTRGSSGHLSAAESEFRSPRELGLRQTQWCLENRAYALLKQYDSKLLQHLTVQAMMLRY